MMSYPFWHCWFYIEKILLMRIAGELRGYDSFWLDANSEVTGNIRVWVDSEQPMTFYDFEINQPDNFLGEQHCVLFNMGRGWDDMECISKWQTICEWPWRIQHIAYTHGPHLVVYHVILNQIILHISVGATVLAPGRSCDCPSACGTTRNDMGSYLIYISLGW